MKFAFALPHMLRLKATMQPWELSVTGADQTRLAKAAEELGYDLIAVPEHIVIPNAHIDLSGPHYFHAAAAQAYLAGATSRIRINSCITILPLHQPLVLAKALSTIDWMSSGRLIITIGVGWLEKEFEILGVPFHERGAITEEYIQAMIELWTKENPEFEGKYVSFKDIAFEPKPYQKPHLPLWMGGDADGPLKRAARYAQGWLPFLTPAEKLGERLDFIKSQPGYDGRPFELMYGLATARVGEGHKVNDTPGLGANMGLQEIVDRMNWLAGMGVTISSVPIPQVSGVDAYLDHAQWVMEEVKPLVA